MWTAEQIYGSVPSAAPSGSAAPQANPASTSQVTQAARPGPWFASPVLWIVIIIALAFGLVHLSFRWSA